MPESQVRIGGGQHGFIHIPVGVVVDTLDASGGQFFPPAAHGFLSFFHILLLLLFGDVGEDLYQHTAALDQFLFKMVDFIKTYIIPFRSFIRISHCMFIPQEIPGPVMDGDLSRRRQFLPELEKERAFFLPFRGLGRGKHPESPGVQGMDHLADQLAPPGRPETFKQDNYRDSGIPDCPLEKAQAVFFLFHPFCIFFFGNFRLQIDFIQHGKSLLSQTPIFSLL